MKLGNLAIIATGLVAARKKADNEPKAKYKLLTLKSMNEDGWIDVDELEDFSSIEELSQQYLTHSGDIVMRLSYPHTAVSINKDFEGILIPSAFAVIRKKSSSILPDFLALYLNSDLARRQITQSSVGSVVPIIKTSSLNEIVIEECPLEIQTKAVEYYRLHLREKQLMMELVGEKEKYNNAVIQEILKGCIK